MAKYKKKPVIVEAEQWFGGARPDLELKLGDASQGIDIPYECCGKMFSKHGVVKTLEGYHIACPGDFIITGIKGEHYPCKPDIFLATYELAEAGKE